MEPLTALAVVASGLSALIVDVGLTLRLRRGYYQLVCRIPARGVGPLLLPPPGTHLRGSDLVVRVASDGLQARSTKKKHHTLLRIGADGQVRVGTSVSMWLCLAGWLGGCGIVAVGAARQPLPEALLLVPVSVGIPVVFGLLLRWQAREMVAAVCRLVTTASAPPVVASLPPGAAPETAGSAGASGPERRAAPA